MNKKSTGAVPKKSTSKPIEKCDPVNNQASSAVASTSTNQNELNQEESKKKFHPDNLTCKFIIDVDKNGDYIYCGKDTFTNNQVAKALCENQHLDIGNFTRNVDMNDIQLKVEADNAYKDHIQNLIDNEVYFYVGKTKKFDDRRRNHKKSIKKLYEKFGIYDKVFERMQVLFVARSGNELKEMETIMIKKCIKTNFCVNAKEVDETEGEEQTSDISFIYVLFEKNKKVAQNNKVGEEILISKGFKKINEKKVFANFNINIDESKKLVYINYNLNEKHYDYVFDIKQNASKEVEGIGKININLLTDEKEEEILKKSEKLSEEVGNVSKELEKLDLKKVY